MNLFIREKIITSSSSSFIITSSITFFLSPLAPPFTPSFTFSLASSFAPSFLSRYDRYCYCEETYDEIYNKSYDEICDETCDKARNNDINKFNVKSVIFLFLFLIELLSLFISSNKPDLR